jgi:hypothetical protein
MERSVGALGTVALRGLRSPTALPHAKRLWAAALLRCAAEEALEGTRAKYEELHQAALAEIDAAGPAIVTQHTAAEAEAGELPDLRQQGDIEMHTPDSLMRRARARRHPDVRVAIAQAWDLLELGADGCLGYEGYAALFTKLHLALLPEIGAAEARASAWEDWRHDVAKHVVVRGVAPSPRSGKPRFETDPSDAQLRAARMGYDAFFDALFELADVWCEHCDGREYALFVANLLACAAGAMPADGGGGSDRGGGGGGGGGYGDAEFAAVGALELREDAAVECVLSGRISAELLRDVEGLGATTAGGMAGGEGNDVPSPSREQREGMTPAQSRAKELWRMVSTRARVAAAFSSTEGWGAAVARDPTAAQAVMWILSRGPWARRGDDDEEEVEDEEEEEKEKEEETKEGRGRKELVFDADDAALDLEPLRPWAALRGELASLAERQAELAVLARVTRARLLPIGAGSGAAWDDADAAAAGGSGGAAHSAGGGAAANAPPGHKAVEKSIRRHLSRLGEALEAAAATSNRAAAHQQRQGRQGQQGRQGRQGRERRALRGGAPNSLAQMRLDADAEAARELPRRQMQGDIKRAARAAIALETALTRARGVATRHAQMQSSTRALAALRPSTASLMSMNPNARDGADGLTLGRQLQRSDRKGAMDANITTVRTSGADVPCSATSWWYLSTVNGGQDVPTLQDDLRRMPPTGVRNTPSRWPQNFTTGRRSRKLR